MTINKSNLLAGLGAGIVIGGLTLGSLSASAHNSGHNLTEEEREAKKTEMLEKKAEHLDSKVEDGTITQEQRDQIDAWMQERQAERETAKEDRPSKEEFQNLSDEEKEALKTERQAMREEKKAEIEEFFSSIGVDAQDIRPDKGEFGRHGHKKGGRF